MAIRKTITGSDLFKETKSFLKWSVIGILTGCIIGLAGAFFHFCSDSAEGLRIKHPWLLFLLPAAGAFIALFYKVLRYSHDQGTNLVLLAVRDNEKMGIRHAVCIFVSTVLTHLCGGSSGREGASLQIGAALGSFSGRIMKFDDDDKRIMTMCSMSAMFAAVFGTPVTAAIFSMEVISVGIFYYSAIVPCVTAALTASYIASLLGGSPLAMAVELPDISPLLYLKTAAVGALCALLSVIFCMVLGISKRLFGRIKIGALRAAVGGAVVVLLTLLVGNRDYNGTGGAMIMSSFSQIPFAGAFLLKLLFTAVTLSSGFKGGEIFPVFFIGSTFGSVISPIFGIDCSLGAALGMTALFCGVTNCPVASILLSIELFGGKGITVYILVCAVSYMLSGYHGLYSEQKIMYSKIRPRFVNKKIGEE
ncbi:MAG: chloride channel protein [Ruminococcus sp.]|nr:chloride channel protein [Ruminococcus sp.]